MSMKTGLNELLEKAGDSDLMDEFSEYVAITGFASVVDKKGLQYALGELDEFLQNPEQAQVLKETIEFMKSHKFGKNVQV